MEIEGSGDSQAEYNNLDIGLMFITMFHDKLGLEDEQRWLPVRPVDNGPLSAACLFKKTNEAGEVDDYVVLKYACSAYRDLFPANYPNISKEAATMMQLNVVGNPSILFLRDHKYLQGTKQFLYMLEYCPNFGTEFSRINYKIMNQLISELFLWYMFCALARGLIAIEEGPISRFLDPLNADLRSSAYVAHFDIKPDNVFLG